MDPIQLTDIAVIPFELENAFGWQFQVIVGGGPVPLLGISLEARLGAQPLECIQVSPDGQGFGGYVRLPPADGDKLFINYPGQEEIETELAYREPVA
jgi:hypothetical protein